MKKQIISYFIKNNQLVQTTTLKKLENPQKLKKVMKLIEENTEIQKILTFIHTDETNEKNKETTNTKDAKVIILSDYTKTTTPKKIKDFINYYNTRFKQFEKLLLPRLDNVLSISRLLKKTDRETISIMGIIVDKHLTKTNKVILTLEDQTGIIKALFNPNKIDSFKTAKDIVLDEIIGVTGMPGNGIIFADKITLPEIPILNEIKKSPEEKYALFIGDLHIGSNLFLEEEFNNFINWLRGEYGTEEQKEIAKKTAYCFIAGDLVAGIGIYPKQEEELKIKDIYEQYKKLVQYIQRIPKHINVIIIPGNHDVGRLAEPQQKIDREFIEELYDQENIFLLSNPSLVNIQSSQTFEGFTVLMYHGYSYDYYADNVESIRMSGKTMSERPPLVSKFLLQRRHLAPAHTSTLTIPDSEADPLFIETVPDFFVTGHIHKSAIQTYRGTTIICTSCWEQQTSFQEKFGHIPDLGKVIAINLKTRKTTIVDFEKCKK